MADIAEIAKRLAEPFPAADIEWRVGATDNKDNPTKGVALAYITNRAVQQRLDDVVGIGNWKNEYQLWRNNGVLCGLSIRIEGEWVTKWDGADESDMEPIKGGLSDAMKRAAYQWGIGRYLYNLDSQWVAVEKRGRTTILKEKPRLPDWALPESERGKGGKRQTATTRTDQAGSGDEATNHTQAKDEARCTREDYELLMSAAEGNGWTADDVKAHLKAEKYAKVSDIPASKFPAILDKFSQPKKAEGA